MKNPIDDLEVHPQKTGNFQSLVVRVFTTNANSEISILP